MKVSDQLQELRSLIQNRSRELATSIGTSFNQNAVQSLKCIFQYFKWQISFHQANFQSIAKELAHQRMVNKAYQGACPQNHIHNHKQDQVVQLRQQLLNIRNEQLVERERANLLQYKYQQLQSIHQQATNQAKQLIDNIDKLQCELLIEKELKIGLQNEVYQLKETIFADDRRNTQVMEEMQQHYRKEIDQLIKMRVEIEDQKRRQLQVPESSLFCSYCRARHQPIPQLEQMLSRACQILQNVFCLSKNNEESRGEWLKKVEILYENQRKEEGFLSRKKKNFVDQQRIRNQYHKNIISRYLLKDQNVKKEEIVS